MNRLLALLGALAVLIIYAALLWWLMQEPSKTWRVEWSPQEKQWVIERMRVHGIWGCESDGKGWYFFYNSKG